MRILVSFLGLVVLLPPLGVQSLAAVRRKPKPVPCPAARYVVAGTLIGADGAVGADAIVVTDTKQVSIASGCPPVRAKITATKKVTKISARWPACGTLKKVHLKATITNNCQTFKGAVKAKKRKRTTVAAQKGFCGDAVVDGRGGEACDPPGGECRDTCQRLRCGDRVVDPGEACDDGNATNDDGCDANCTLSACGNGILNTGEQCDDGNLDNLDGCTVDCMSGTAPPFVRITGPPNGAVLANAPIVVEGLVQPGIITLTVSGRAATITGTRFTVSGVPLEEGRNVVSATAEHVTGPTGTDAVSLTLDTAPPTVTIEAPRDHSIVNGPVVSVAGLVNDTAPGVIDATDLQVAVNGVPVALAAGTFLAAAVPVAIGRNVIVARAVDVAGNVGTREIVVTRATAGAGQGIRIVSGNEQAGLPGGGLAPLVVQVDDALGHAVPRLPLRFRVTRGDGRFGNGQREITVTTDAAGRAQTGFGLGSRLGAGLHRVTVDAPGELVGEAVFCQSVTPGPPAMVNVLTADTQTVPAGGTTPSPLVVIARDAAANPISGAAVLFQRDQGTGTFPGRSTTARVVTDSDGRAATPFVAGPAEGTDVVSVRIEGAEAVAPATFTIDRMVPGTPADTVFSGVVLDNANQPLPGVVVRVVPAPAPREATTDSFGRFRITGVPPGAFTLEVVGTSGFPSLTFNAFAISGVESSLPEPIYLPRTDVAGAQTAGNSDVDVLVDQVPGARLRVCKGSVRRANGALTASVSITQVNQDKVPMPLPGGLAPRLVVSIQPADATFNPPAELTLPNVEGLPPGYVTEILSFDHDLEEYVVRGTMTVSEDGSMLRTDPGFGITKGGWHGGGGPPPPRGDIDGDVDGPNDGPPDPDAGPDGQPPKPGNDPGDDTTDDLADAGDGGDDDSDEADDDATSKTTHKGGDDIIYGSGELLLSFTDLRIPGRGFSFEMKRTYRSQYNYDGPLGHNWDYDYNEQLMLPGPGDTSGRILRCTGRSRVDAYQRENDGSYTSPAGRFDGLRLNQDGSYTVRARNGFKRHFNAAGRLTAQVDRHGNTMSFAYDAQGQLATVIDTLGRNIVFAYNPAGRLASVTDFIGRQILYHYDVNGDLVAVRSPVVVGTSTGNDFPDGKTTRYGYASGFGGALTALNHNLLSITDPKGQRYLVNTYGTDPTRYEFDRVLTQQEGRADQVSRLAYAALTPPNPQDPNAAVNETIETDRNGNRRVYRHNAGGNLLRVQIDTNRDVNPDDPASFVTTHTYNADGRRISTVFPEGNRVDYEFDVASPTRAQQGNLLAEVSIPGPRGGDQTQIRRTYAYEPIYNQRRAMTDPRGTAVGFVPPNGGVASAARYTSTMTFDYQEGAAAALATELATTAGVVTQLLADEGMVLGLGDQNGDGVTNQIQGNVVRVDDPTVTLLPTSQQATLEGGTAQPLVTTHVYNRFGQQIATRNAAGNVHTMEYYPESDPDGDGVESISSRTLADDTGGYLRGTVRDTAHPGGGAPLALRRESAYDEVGNLIRAMDGFGNATSIERNAQNQTVRETARAPFNYEHRYLYDANGNVVREESQNVDTTGPDLGAAVVITSTYDVLDQLLTRSAAVSQGASLTTRYEYDRNQNRVRVVQPEGNVVERVFDERDLVFRHIHGAGSPEVATRTTTYDGNGLLRSSLDAQDHNGDGQPEATVQIYDGFNRLKEVVDPLGNRVVETYDPAGNRIRTQLFGRDGGPSPTNASGAGNGLLAQSESRHDELGRCYQRDDLLFSNVAVVGPEGPLTPGDGRVTRRSEFDRLGRLTRTLDDNGHDTRMAYDPADRVVQAIDALGNELRYTFDANDNRVLEERIERSPEGTVPAQSFLTQYEFDALDRLTAIIDPLGNRTSQTWDSRNNRTTVRDPMGNTRSQVYDGQSRLLATVVDLRSGGTGSGDLDPTNPTNTDGRILTQSEYDGNSRVRAMVDDNGNRTAIAYDALNRRTRETYADGTIATWTHDRDGNVTTFSDQNGTVHANTYDGGHRLVQKSVTRGPGIEGSTDWTFEYDGHSRVTRATDDNDPADGGDDSVIESQWDSLGRLLVQIQNGRTLASTVDGVGNRIGFVYPSGRTLAITVDALDRLDTVSEVGQPTPIVDYDYLGPSRVLERRYRNGTRLRQHDGAGNAIGFDGARRTVALRHETTAGAPLAAFEQVYDRVGNRRYEHDVVQSQADVFQYDSAYRLVRSVAGASPTLVSGLANNASTNADVTAVTGSAVSDFRLDGLGNWRARTTNGSTVARTVNAVNEYVAIGAAAQTYDDNGNLRDDGAQQYRFDFANRLVRVLNGAGAQLARYRYDVYGRRVRRDVGASTTIYLNDGHAVAEERDGAGTVLRQFVDGGGLDEHVELRRGDDARFFYHANVLNSVAAVTDAAGAVVERYRYDAYGVPTILAPNGTTVRSSSTIDNPYLFTGRRLDPESGLYHYRARYLHPQQGRFIHRDPRGAADGMNRYAYVGNNPVNLVDPFGTEKEEPSSSPKKPCPPENSIREKARETLWALAYEEGRVGSFEQFTAAYGAQDKTEHALFGEGAMMGMEPTVPGMSKPWEAISANGGRFLPKREHQIFVPGVGEVDLRWLVQGYATTGNPWGLEGFGGGVKWAGAELYSLQYTIPEGQKIGEGSFLGGITGPLAAHVVKTDANTQINHMSFEMGRQLRDGTLFKVQTGEWEDRYGMTHPIYRPGTLEDLARMTVGDPPANERYKQSSDVPPDWMPELGKTALKGYNNSPSGGDDCK